MGVSVQEWEVRTIRNSKKASHIRQCSNWIRKNEPRCPSRNQLLLIQILSTNTRLACCGHYMRFGITSCGALERAVVTTVKLDSLAIAKPGKSKNSVQNCWELIPSVMGSHWKFQSRKWNAHVLLFGPKVSITQLKEYCRCLNKSSSNRVSAEYPNFTNYSEYSDFNSLGS